MKKIMFVSACIVALSTAGAFAQSQPAPGASSEGNVGPGATATTRHHGTMHHATRHTKSGVTTGMATTRHPKSESGTAKQSGGRY